MIQSQATGTVRPVLAVVDNDESFLRSIGRLLRSVGYAVKTYGSAGEFLASLPESSPQCLVLNVHLPGMTCLELQDRLVAQGFCIPVIFVTTYDTPAMRKSVRQAGSLGLLLKPFDKRVLLNTVGAAVGCQPWKASRAASDVESVREPDQEIPS